MRLFLDIHSKKPWPSCRISNFSPNCFCLDGMHFQCMEGFLQSLKEENTDRQAEYQFLDAKSAKARGSQIRWQETGMLYWRGQSFSRYDRKAYRALLIRAYDALAEESPDFCRALAATGHAFLWHSVGKIFRSQTCLTTFEFLSLLYRQRRRIRRRRNGHTSGQQSLL